VIYTIGRFLVLINTFLALLGLGLALVIYFDFVDWGRSTPRSVRGEPVKAGAGNDLRIASEYDKSKVLFDHAVKGRDLAIGGQGEPPLANAENSLGDARIRMAQNHLFYAAQLKSLRSGNGNIEVKAMPPEGMPTDTPGKATGKAVPSVKLDGLNRSIVAYTEELKNDMAKLDPLQKKVRDLAEANSKVSYQLTGKDDAGKRVTHGIIELVDQEYAMQQRLLQEREQLQPYWASTIEEARRYGARRSSLEGTLTGLKDALKARDGK
jgi:hypothetical protein